MDSIAIQPAGGPVSASIRPPGSKSLTNRAFICAALAEGESLLQGVLDSEDTRVMAESLRRLGIETEPHWERSEIRVSGCGGQIPAQDADLFLANSGTSIRFLTALTALGRGRYRLDGIERMRQRPIADLLAALNQLGADVRSENDTGCPPVSVVAAGLPGGKARVRGNISSQFLSALLMTAPYSQTGVELEVEGELVSKPYVAMTLAVMDAFSTTSFQGSDLQTFRFAPGRAYQGRTYAIEPDASAASYFWAAAAITGGKATVEGLSRNALQGDVGFCECLEKMGCRVEYSDKNITVFGESLRGGEFDMNAISDTVQTLSAVALFAEGSTTITGVAHNRHKETDRIGDLACELRKFGAVVDELPDGLRITPPAEAQAAEVETYNDHRMAMSLSLPGLRVPGVVIRNPRCTEKTYPRFFDDLNMFTQGASGASLNDE